MPKKAATEETVNVREVITKTEQEVAAKKVLENVEKAFGGDTKKMAASLIQLAKKPQGLNVVLKMYERGDAGGAEYGELVFQVEKDGRMHDVLGLKVHRTKDKTERVFLEQDCQSLGYWLGKFKAEGKDLKELAEKTTRRGQNETAEAFTARIARKAASLEKLSGQIEREELRYLRRAFTTLHNPDLMFGPDIEIIGASRPVRKFK